MSQWSRGVWRPMLGKKAAIMSLLVLSLLGLTAFAQQQAPLQLFNNYFVSGDYVVGGVGLRGAGDVTGFATGTITIPDANSVPITGVPAGADIVAAFLYWETVESSQTTFAGQQGYFNSYPIAGTLLGNPNAPVSWSAGGCSGASNGSKTMRTYRADVRPYLRLDSSGRIIGVVKLADSGSNGAGAPLTLGASLVVIYRVLSPATPLNSVVLYDGAFAPSNSSQGMSQQVRGFYEAAATPVAKVTHIVGNGQANKFEQVSLLNDKSAVVTNLPSLYSLNGAPLPAFPGYYSSTPGQIFDGSWDNPTWVVNNYGNAVNAEDGSETTQVVPSATNSGCVSWGAVIFSSTVQDTDNDGLLDAWEINQGYTDAKDGSLVALTGANPTQKDIFIQLDYMCSVVNPDGTCNTTAGHSHVPDPAAVTMLTNAFSRHGVNVHVDVHGVIPESTCTDGTDAAGNPVLCPYPGQPGVVGWKGGFEYFKNQPLNYPDEISCETATTPACVRRFQHGRKDSYHYVLFGHAVGLANWILQDGTLASLSVLNNVATFTTSLPHGLAAVTDRVTVSDAISAPGLNGTYFVQTVPSPTTFTIATSNVPAGAYTKTTDPSLSASSGRAGTGSGYSDIGGADSTVTLGRWGADGQTVSVQAGTFMHELGHTLALTHGGLYFDTPNSSVATVEANCKPNFQSVMNYLFQVDLLGPNGVLDYSSQELIPLNEAGLTGITGLTTTMGASTAYSTTKWYAPSQPIGSPATTHCDGSPLLPTDTPRFRIDGPTTPITTWFTGEDLNFDGSGASNLRGYNDWSHVDLRQIGATGSNIPGGGIFGVGGGIFGVGGGIFGVGGGIFGVGGGIFGVGGGIFGVGGGIFGVGGGIFGVGGGTGHSEITVEAANSVVRSPRNLAAAVTSTPPRFIQLTWTSPSFGQITAYNVYRGVNAAPVAPPYATVTGNPPATAFLDQNVACGPTYTYFVTALLSDGRESVPSNSVSIKDCAPPYTFTGFFSPLSPAGDSSYSGAFNIGKSVTSKWTLQDSSGNFVGNLNANTLFAVGPVPLSASGACLPSNAPVFSSFTTLNQAAYPFPISTLYSPTTGAKGNSTFRISSSNNQFIFNWDTTPFKAGCYLLELDLDSGQVERTGLNLR